MWKRIYSPTCGLYFVFLSSSGFHLSLSLFCLSFSSSSFFPAFFVLSPSLPSLPSPTLSTTLNGKLDASVLYSSISSSCSFRSHLLY